MDGQSNKRRRRSNIIYAAGTADSEGEDAEPDVMGSGASNDSLNTSTPSQVHVVDAPASLAAPEKSTQPPVVGGALRRNPDGTYTSPRVVKRKNSSQKVCLSMIYSSRSRYMSLGKLPTVVETICATGP